MAGVDAAGAQVHDEVKVEDASGAGGDGRDFGHDAGAVAGDQDVGGEAIGMSGDEFAQTGGAALLAGLEQQFEVETEGAGAFGENGLERGEVEGVLAFVVGGASAVPAVAFGGEGPGRKALAPLIVQAADGVAVAVGENRGAVRALEALGEQDWAEAGDGIGVDLDGEAEALEPGLDADGQVTLDVGLVGRVLGGAGDFDQFCKVVVEYIGIK
jgi:hypothetical protein